ncbi:hypothetical protein [Hydrogenophaga sp.]|uniref:hypothetical protein n=1 Tax=Hydrogenophaga sp. TaxID=1904254 RepID=UPI00271F309B|nr:hypothetical protein [Hydrogenophaga sp.]MDO9434072.1 hypothetical protein [Hydrogenophaga sp.]
MGAGVSQSSSADKAKRLQAREDLKNFGVLRERALQRDAFMNAMSTRKVAEIDKACARFPKDAELASYLPIIIREKLGGIELKFYVEGGGKDPRVTAYVDWCLRYGNELPELHSYLVGDRSQPEPVAPELYDLCLDLRLLKDTDSDASLKKSALIIKKKIAANEDTSALALARQPYASTRMMLQKCVLLAPYIDGQKFAGFFINLQQAHEIRKTSTTALRLALVNKALSARDLREHALNVYARRMTIPTGSFIPSDAKPALLKAMHDTLLVLSVESDIHWMEDEALSQLKALIKQKMDQLG